MVPRRVLISLVVLLLISLPALANSRRFDAVYTATLTDLPRKVSEIKVWIPLPQSTSHQRISDLQVESAIEWKEGRETENGNRYLFATIPSPKDGTLRVLVHFRGERSEVLLGKNSRGASEEELERNVRADRLVTISPRIQKLAREITRDAATPLGQARAIYDYLLATMKYDKTIPGWGKGDSERACDIQAGNCTDFHSLFLSLARAKQIPSRFIIGFPMSNPQAGESTGYHCWAEFYLDRAGWLPIDASDASKSSEPVMRNFLFGNLDANRVEFAIGRDLVLSPPTKEPLNYFIYPYAEAGGEPAGVPTISLKYEERPSSAVTAVTR